MTIQAPKRVLAIDDDVDHLTLLIHSLKKAFPDVKVKALDVSKSKLPGPNFDWSKYDVLILDYQLGPKLTGLDWLRQVKRKGIDFPATILLTAAGSEEVAVRALRYGAHDYLRKQDLTVERLTESVADAFNMRVKQSEATASMTINASRFSKSFFYGQFSLAFDEAEKGKNRALVLVRVDDFEKLRSSLGVLGTDAIARHLAKASIDLFQRKNYKPRVTRFTDMSIAMLAGEYGSSADLEKSLKQFCKTIELKPPEFDGARIPVIVSVGAVIIKSRAPGVVGLLEAAEKVTLEAARTGGNSVLVKTSEPPELKKPTEDEHPNKAEKKPREKSEQPHSAKKTPKDKPKPARRTEKKPADEAEAPPSPEREEEKKFDVRAALREDRIQAMFRPWMKVSEQSAKLPISEIFHISPRFVTHEGEMLRARTVLEELNDEKLSRMVDRWKVRECIGRLLSADLPDENACGFYIELSEASCTDGDLVAWIKALIAHHGKPRRLGAICLAVSANVFMRHLKPLKAFIEHGQKQHGFLFALTDAEDPSLCKACFTQFPFELMVLSDEVVNGIIKKGPEHDYESLLAFETKRGALTVASGIADAAGLTAVISAGVDLVQGDFVADEQEEVEAAVGIESVQIE